MYETGCRLIVGGEVAIVRTASEFGIGRHESTSISRNATYCQRCSGNFTIRQKGAQDSQTVNTPTIQNLHTEARQLKSKMAEVQKNIYQVHKETGACMANLERLDSMKTKLTIAKEGLQESDGWGKLTTELDELFEQNEITKSCEKLKSLQRSLVAQIGLLGQAEREMQIEGYKNRLEALASPTVVQCFSSVNTEQSRQFVEIFDGMNRLPQLIQYYVTVQKQILQQHWSEMIDLSQNTSSTQFLREFYDYLFESYQRQQKWCDSVFGSSGNEAPITVLIEILQNMQPSRESTIVNVLKRSDDKLVILQDFSSANMYLGKKFLATFESSAGINVGLMNRLADAIYGYFATFIGQTASFEQNWLATKLSEHATVYPTASESVRALGSANSKIFQWANETLNRCTVISHNCGLPAIVVVLSVSNIYIRRSETISRFLKTFAHSFTYRISSKLSWKNIKKPSSSYMQVKAMKTIGICCRRAFHYCSTSVITV